ncbi:MAG: hypothetical protein HRF47_11880 [Chloroflexota bacterium]|jgi:hypothetical protein
MMDNTFPPSSPVIEAVETESNLLLGLIGGGFAMLVSAIVWGAVTYFTEYQIGWMAIGVGFLVGIAVRFFGKGRSALFGIVSAALALLGCVLGNLLFYSGVIAREAGASFFEVFFFLLITPSALIEVFTLAFNFMDLLFYGLAAWVGYNAATDRRQRKA